MSQSAPSAPLLPKLRHFTIDPNREIPEDLVLTPAAGFDAEDTERMVKLATDAREEQVTREHEAAKAATAEPRKPSELVNVPAGAAPDTTGQAPKKSKS